MDDDKRDFEDINEEENFADLLEQSIAGIKPLTPGQQIEATVLQVGEQWIFLDVGQKGEGVLDAREFHDDEGKPTVAAGDRVKVFFLSRAGGELQFTTRVGGGSAGHAQLEEAWRNGIPVEGRLEKEVKGGYEIRLPGNVRAFLPVFAAWFAARGKCRGTGRTESFFSDCSVQRAGAQHCGVAPRRA